MYHPLPLSLFQARTRGLDVYGRFGYTLHTGNTPDPMKTILREINDEERTNSIGRAGSQVGALLSNERSSRKSGGYSLIQ